MELVHIVVLVALLEFFVLSILVGKARTTYSIDAPATTGDIRFERIFRAQQNTLEALIIFLPSIYIFAYHVSALVAAALGCVFVIGRAIYFKTYSAGNSRMPGMMLGSLANMAMLIGGLISLAIGVL